MAFDPDAVLPRFVGQYQAAHNGSDPYSDAWPWAEAIVRWHQDQDPPVLPGRGFSLGDAPQAREHLVAAVAESLRILMAWSGAAIGDLDLSHLGSELRILLEAEDDDGARLMPGSSGWPAPTGPYAGRWHALMHMIGSDPEQWALVRRSVSRAFDSLLWHARHLPHLADGAYNTVLDYRLRLAQRPRGDYRSLAEVALSLGMSPVPVRDPRWYQGYDLMTTAEAS
ncbi:hypothetical protein AQI95_28985 [Streptomyces yokosukanensis]|uniref:Uncharacterized protein n=1 Tax=Streptomyces yokosukanensis TaxID=67386 RepID=A0A117Q0D1_9ACTN|nr:hypothetical protein [Streptomyces yokosukanensis]KUN02113.1 hypothetical protein AQI95_28985 [Streptomyces yokosukanensis]